MDCVDLESLRANYKAAVDEYTAAIQKLQGIKKIPSKGFSVADDEGERARVKAEAARRALRNHIIELGCA